MSNPFNIQPQDNCLGMLHQSSQLHSSILFKAESQVSEDDPSSYIFDSQNMAKPTPPQKDQKQIQESHSTSRKKVFYRDKMTSLVASQQSKNKTEYKYSEHNQSSRGNARSPISRAQQLLRNRQSAKSSRQRRKEYIQTLQQSNEENMQKIQELSARVAELENQRDRLKDDNRSYMKTFMTAKNQAYESLADILRKSGKQSSDKLCEELQILVARYGAAGSQRIAATDYYMKQIIEMLLSDIHKYVVQCVVKDCGLFGLGDWTPLDDQVCKILKINKEARVKLSKNYKSKMLQEFETFKTVSQNFYDAYRAVQTQARTIEKQFERITLQFNDTSIAELILWLEQNKFSKQIKKIRADWARSVQQPEEPIGKARKINSFMAMEDI